MALTGKQQAFVNSYISSGMKNAADAYRSAYNTKASPSVCAVQANKLLSHAQISVIIAEARAKAAKQAVAVIDRFVVTKERISAALARLAFADARKLYKWTAKGVELLPSDELHDDDAAAVISVSQTVTKDGGTIKVSLGDKRQALMDLAKLHGHVVEKRDVRVIKSVQDLTDEELAMIIAIPGATDGLPSSTH